MVSLFALFIRIIFGLRIKSPYKILSHLKKFSFIYFFIVPGFWNHIAWWDEVLEHFVYFLKEPVAFKYHPKIFIFTQVCTQTHTTTIGISGMVTLWLRHRICYSGSRVVATGWISSFIKHIYITFCFSAENIKHKKSIQDQIFLIEEVIKTVYFQLYFPLFNTCKLYSQLLALEP